LNRSWEWEYLSFRLCIGVWVGVFLFILVALDASAYVCYITRYSTLFYIWMEPIRYHVMI
jgi:hypothetical protein